MAPPRLPSLHPGGGALGAARPRRLSTLVEGSGGGRERGLSATASTAGTVTPKPIGDTPASEPHSEPHLPSTIHSSDSVWVGKAFFSRFFYGAFIIHMESEIHREIRDNWPNLGKRRLGSGKRRLGNPCQINVGVHVRRSRPCRCPVSATTWLCSRRELAHNALKGAHTPCPRQGDHTNYLKKPVAARQIRLSRPPNAQRVLGAANVATQAFAASRSYDPRSALDIRLPCVRLYAPHGKVATRTRVRSQKPCTARAQDKYQITMYLAKRLLQHEFHCGFSVCSLDASV